MAAVPANHRVLGGGGERPTLLYSGGASRGPPGTTISNLEDQLNTPPRPLHTGKQRRMTTHMQPSLISTNIHSIDSKHSQNQYEHPEFHAK